jgi:hypothetical protein
MRKKGFVLWVVLLLVSFSVMAGGCGGGGGGAGGGSGNSGSSSAIDGIWTIVSADYKDSDTSLGTVTGTYIQGSASESEIEITVGASLVQDHPFKVVLSGAGVAVSGTVASMVSFQLADANGVPLSVPQMMFAMPMGDEVSQDHYRYAETSPRAQGLTTTEDQSYELLNASTLRYYDKLVMDNDGSFIGSPFVITTEIEVILDRVR